VAFTAEDLETIRRAIATGELRVRYADREVEYRSIDDLLKAEKRILGSLNGRPKQHRGVTDKGL
jgi:hypothetical protein